MYNNRIVIDLDDTISVTFDRDWENSTPVLPVIGKINQLYDLGWEICIVTARGQLSCKGDSKKADDKYRTQIETWLKKHGVKYTSLSFEKVLATYYVDDKSLSPEDFTKLNVVGLQGGLSGAKIEKVGDKVYKTHKNSLQAVKWYSIIENYDIRIPKIHSIIGDTICMEYIEDCPIKQPHFPSLTKAIDIFSGIKVKGVPFDNYIERIHKHAEYHGEFSEIVDELVLHSKFYEEFSSFCHGDFSIDNILIDRKGSHYLIDPIYEEDSWSSWLLDVSKLAHSYRRYDKVDTLWNIYEHYRHKVDWNHLKLLEITQWIRVLKYLKDQREINRFRNTIDVMMYEYFGRNRKPKTKWF